MKNLKLFLFIITLAIFSQACRKGSIWGIYGKGASVTKTLNLSGFSSINLKCDGNITYVQDSVYKVEITAQENIIAIMETKIVDAELRFSFLREVRTHDDINIVIHCPRFNALTINGSGNFRAANTVTASNAGIYLNGSGNVTFETLNFSTIDSKIAGSGNINLNGGKGTTTTFNISGSGNVIAAEMECLNGFVKVSGSGNVSINATKTLDVSVSGSGDVRYKGNPTITSSFSGSGKLIHIN